MTKEELRKWRIDLLETVTIPLLKRDISVLEAYIVKHNELKIRLESELRNYKELTGKDYQDKKDYSLTQVYRRSCDGC